jgi:hypothetical protein
MEAETPLNAHEPHADVQLTSANIDYGKVSNIVFEDVDHSDAPDYCDAHIVSAEYDGVEMTDEQIELLNNDSDFVYDSLIASLY